MSEFIEVRIDQERCLGMRDCGKCVQVCPVNIFADAGKFPEPVDENKDECTLCELCLLACGPVAIGIKKLYES